MKLWCQLSSTKYQQDENGAITSYVIEQISFVIEPEITFATIITGFQIITDHNSNQD